MTQTWEISNEEEQNNACALFFFVLARTVEIQICYSIFGQKTEFKTKIFLIQSHISTRTHKKEKWRNPSHVISGLKAYTIFTICWNHTFIANGKLRCYSLSMHTIFAIRRIIEIVTDSRVDFNLGTLKSCKHESLKTCSLDSESKMNKIIAICSSSHLFVVHVVDAIYRIL